MEVWNNIDPFWDGVMTWGFRITVGCLLLLFFYALFNRTLTKDQLEKELTGDDNKEGD